MISIHGERFSPDILSIMIGGNPCLVVERVSHQLMTCKSPPGFGRNLPITLVSEEQLHDPSFNDESSSDGIYPSDCGKHRRHNCWFLRSTISMKLALNCSIRVCRRRKVGGPIEQLDY